MGPYKNEEEMMKTILYWQKRALAAESQIEMECDAYEYMVDIVLKEREEHAEEMMELKKKMYKRGL